MHKALCKVLRDWKMNKHGYYLQGSYSDNYVISLISFSFGYFHRFLQNSGIEKTWKVVICYGWELGAWCSIPGLLILSKTFNLSWLQYSYLWNDRVDPRISEVSSLPKFFAQVLFPSPYSSLVSSCYQEVFDPQILSQGYYVSVI